MRWKPNMTEAEFYEQRNQDYRAAGMWVALAVAVFASTWIGYDVYSWLIGHRPAWIPLWLVGPLLPLVLLVAVIVACCSVAAYRMRRR
jgi:hypothetical protein